MKLIFAVLDVSLTMGLTRCYKTEDFYTFYTIINNSNNNNIIYTLYQKMHYHIVMIISSNLNQFLNSFTAAHTSKWNKISETNFMTDDDGPMSSPSLVKFSLHTPKNHSQI